MRQNSNLFIWVKKKLFTVRICTFYLQRAGEGNGTEIENDGKKVKKFARSKDEGKKRSPPYPHFFFICGFSRGA